MNTLNADAIANLPMDDLAPGKDQTAEDEAITHAQGFLTSWDGKRLFWQSWASTDAHARRARVALMHGYGEHSSRYAHVAAALVRAGYDVWAMDARGHGRSEGVDAHVALYDEYVLDFERLVDLIDEEWGTQTPLFVLGHSNGGLIALRYAMRRPEAVRAFVVTSPMCGLAVKVPLWKEKAGNLMSKLWPTFALPTDLPPGDLTHDPFVVEQYAKDPLVKSVATSRWFTEATQAQQDLARRAGRIQHPLLMLVAGADAIVSAPASQALFEDIGSEDRELGVYDKLFHEILNETQWAEITRRIITWMEERRVLAAQAGEEE